MLIPSGRSLFIIAVIPFMAAQADAFTVNWNDEHQKIDGFGASSAWRSSMTEAQADMFFSVQNGIGLSLLRSRITPSGTTVELSIMQQAVARGVRVWSVPWSPPASWKDNGSVSNGGHLLTEYYPDYADQLAEYVADLQSSGVDLYAISIQNEPDYSAAWESCLYTDEQMHDFVPYLHSALAARDLLSTKILVGEQGAWSLTVAWATLGDSSTAEMVGILGAHQYGGSIQPLYSGGKALWETEVSSFGSFDPSMTNALYWAENIHAFMTVAEANAWHYWWLISNNPDNEGLTDQSGNPAKRMYAVGQFSKFIRPGYLRIGVTESAGSLLASAYKDSSSGEFAIVVVNIGYSDAVETVSLAGFSTDTVIPWLTSSSASLLQLAPLPVSDASFAYAFPAQSIITFRGSRLAACCTPDGGCALTTQPSCVFPNVWAEWWTTCTPSPCSQQQGICCTEAGACVITIQANCAPPSTWHDEWTSCNPNPCPQPGPCCTSTGACTVVVQANCGLPSTWHGDWTSCEPNPCPQPGACCTSAGECTTRLQANCELPDTWHGDWTSCYPNPCPQPTGACCALVGTCTVTTPGECVSPSVWQGASTDCSPNLCVATGACCNLAVGTCTMTTQDACVAPNTWQGAGTDCSPNPCVGACCAPDGTCETTTQVPCVAPRSWQGSGTTCHPNSCPQPTTGACCFTDGHCEELTAAQCQQQGGTYQANGSLCEPNPCHPIMACCLAEGHCMMLWDVTCRGNGGIPEAPGSVCNPNPCPTSGVAEFPSGPFPTAASPSPTHSDCRISYWMPVGGRVVVQIVDVQGRVVREIVRESQSMGGHSLIWNGKDEAGKVVPTGVYLVRVMSSQHTTTTRVVLAR